MSQSHFIHYINVGVFPLVKVFSIAVVVKKYVQKQIVSKLSKTVYKIVELPVFLEKYENRSHLYQLFLLFMLKKLRYNIFFVNTHTYTYEDDDYKNKLFIDGNGNRTVYFFLA